MPWYRIGSDRIAFAAVIQRMPQDDPELSRSVSMKADFENVKVRHPDVTSHLGSRSKLCYVFVQREPTPPCGIMVRLRASETNGHRRAGDDGDCVRSVFCLLPKEARQAISERFGVVLARSSSLG